jgi:hypothetical protein
VDLNKLKRKIIMEKDAIIHKYVFEIWLPRYTYNYFSQECVKNAIRTISTAEGDEDVRTDLTRMVYAKFGESIATKKAETDLLFEKFLRYMGNSQTGCLGIYDIVSEIQEILELGGFNE